MPRSARKTSKTGIYHVMLRGINHQVIFADEEDGEKFLECLKASKQRKGFELYAYCLMGNHVHLLVKEGPENIAQAIRSLGARYVYWYNWKYERIGHLFQDRYKSEPVEDDAYFLAVLRYIYQNPIQARLSKTVEEYRWSSYRLLGEKTTIIDHEQLFEIINQENLKQYVNEVSQTSCLELKSKKRISDEAAAKHIKEQCKLKHVITIKN